MENISFVTPEKAYEEAGRGFVEATKPITDYYWNKAMYNNNGHSRVVSPKHETGSERFYVVQSEEFMGFIETESRWVSQGSGIAIVRYNNVSNNSKLEKLVKVETNRQSGIDTQFMTIPDELLLIVDDTFRYRENEGKINSWQYVPTLGLAVYPKDHIKKALVRSKKPYLNLGVEFGRLSLKDGYRSRFNGQYDHNHVGQSIFLDQEDVPFQSISWPTIVYNPNKDGDDPFAWSTCQKRHHIDDPIPKNTTFYTADIKALQEKWLAPFSAGIREVSKSEL